MKDHSISNSKVFNKVIDPEHFIFDSQKHVPPGYSHAIILGTNGLALRGYRPNWHPPVGNGFGDMIPTPQIAGEAIYNFTVDTGSNNVSLALGVGGNVQAAGVSNFQITYEIYGLALTLSWFTGPDLYQATDAALTTHWVNWFTNTPTI